MKMLTRGLLLCILSCTEVFAQTGLTGVWQNDSYGYAMALLLYDNGTGEFDGDEMTYQATASQLMLTIGGELTVYSYRLDGAHLTLSGGDLDQPVTFERLGTGQPNAETSQLAQGQHVNNAQVATAGPEKSDKAFMGVWSAQGTTLDFKDNGLCIYMGQNYGYRLSGNQLLLQTNQGEVAFTYALEGDQLTLSANGKSVVYIRGVGAAATGSTPGSMEAGGKRIAMELVGKWCYVNVATTNTGGYTSDRCITLNADGTYLYHGENSSSVNTSTYNGGTNSQSDDLGTWNYDGSRIYYQSQSGQSGSFLLQKQNHPKNGDPMIVLDGTAYVTYYQKAPW